MTRATLLKILIAHYGESDRHEAVICEVLGASKMPIEERKKNFANSIAPFVTEYARLMCLDFFHYWTEIGDNGKKMRFEKEKVFEISKRLKRWSDNQNYRNGSKQQSTNRARSAFEQIDSIADSLLQGASSNED